MLIKWHYFSYMMRYTAFQDARAILSTNTVLKRCHPRHGREAAVGDPEKSLYDPGSPTFGRG